MVHLQSIQPSTVGDAQVSRDRVLWALISGAALGGVAGAAFAATTKPKGPQFDLMNYVTFGAFVGAGAMGLWRLIRD